MNNKLKYKKKVKWFYFLLLFFSINFHGCKKEKQTSFSNANDIFQENYIEIPIQKIKIKDDLQSIIYKLKYQGIEDVLLILKNEKAFLQIDNKKIISDFNYNYDITLDDAIKEVKMLSDKQGNIIIILPIATEEFLTYQLLKYSKVDKQFFASYFSFDTIDDTLQQYLNSGISLQESKNQYNIKIGKFNFKGTFENIENFEKETSSISTEENENVQNNYLANRKNFKFQTIENLKGQYNITTKAISLYNSEKIDLTFSIYFENDKNAILSIGAEQVEDYWCEGTYNLIEENNILHATGKCTQNDQDDFYIKKENDQLYIKSKRFLNKDWQKLING